MDKLFEMINQDFKAQGTKYQVLPNLGICCRELAGLKVTSFLRMRAQLLLCLARHGGSSSRFTPPQR